MTGNGNQWFSPLSEAEKAAVLVAATDAARFDVAAEAWVDRVLRNFLDRGKELPPIPEALADDIQVTPEASRLDPEEWVALGRCLAESVSLRQLDPPQALRVSVPQAVRFADLAVRQRHNAERRELRRLSGSGGASWEWTERQDGLWKAAISIGSLGFRVQFLRDGYEPHRAWERGWEAERETWAILNRDTLRDHKWYPRGTGLFPMIDRCLKKMTKEFLEEVQPTSLRIMGSDPKRNAHNSATYASCAPDGFEIVAIRNDGSSFATEDGVVGIRFVRSDVTVDPNDGVARSFG